MRRIVISFAISSLIATFSEAQTLRHPSLSLRPFLVFGAASNADAIFSAIDFPGSTGTQAWGIDPSGDIVGYYTVTGGETHGFLLSRGNFCPGDQCTRRYRRNLRRCRWCFPWFSAERQRLDLHLN